MSTSKVAVPPVLGSVIELERLPSRCGSTKSEDAKSAIARGECDTQTTVAEAQDVHLERTRSRATRTDIESEAQATEHEDRSDGLDGSEDGSTPHRNVSSLYPTDEGFHAWAFVSIFLDQRELK